MEPGINLFNLTSTDMREFINSIGNEPFRSTQLMKWMYSHGVIEIDKMTDLSKQLREKLALITSFQLPEIISEQNSADGTRKWKIRVDDHNCIETVFIPEADRGTLCVSSQVGCALDCKFCSTGKQGYSRNLSVHEIIGQVWLANMKLGYFKRRKRIITNIVMMGMGEPLLNFDNVVRAIELMKDDLGFGIAAKRITLSTAGVVPAIDKLAVTTRVSLAISLHAPNNELRDILVPINRSYPIKELLEACERYSRTNNNDPITFEYVMLSGINDGDSEAWHLVSLLKRLPAKINLIPFNPFLNSGYTCSPKKTIDRFHDILTNAGIFTITRKTRGDDIDAACGQLVGQIVPKAKRHQVMRYAEERR